MHPGRQGLSRATRQETPQTRAPTTSGPITVPFHHYVNLLVRTLGNWRGVDVGDRGDSKVPGVHDGLGS